VRSEQLPKILRSLQSRDLGGEWRGVGGDGEGRPHMQSTLHFQGLKPHPCMPNASSLTHPTTVSHPPGRMIASPWAPAQLPAGPGYIRSKNTGGLLRAEGTPSRHRRSHEWRGKFRSTSCHMSLAGRPPRIGSLPLE
jgi:hypothetical protein